MGFKIRLLFFFPRVILGPTYMSLTPVAVLFEVKGVVIVDYFGCWDVGDMFRNFTLSLF